MLMTVLQLNINVIHLCWLSFCIRTVLEKLGNRTVDRLPQQTFANQMLLEARFLGLSHLQEELANCEGNATVGIDGTSKHEKHYGTAVVSFANRAPMVPGLEDMACDDAETYLNTLLEMVRNVAETQGTEGSDQRTKEIGNSDF